jgi:hypothetical protein
MRRQATINYVCSDLNGTLVGMGWREWIGEREVKVNPQRQIGGQSISQSFFILFFCCTISFILIFLRLDI